MNTLLLFFALPIATIIISIALQFVFKNPLLVSSIIFAFFLVVTFILNDLNFLVATIVYTIISFITAMVVCLVYSLNNNLNNTSISLSNSIGNDNQISDDFVPYNNQGISSKINVYSNNRIGNKRCSRGRRIF